MWWWLLGSIVLVSMAVLLRRGPVAALGCGVLASFLFPCWITQNFLGVPIDLRVATSIVLLLLNLFHPQRRISWRFTAGDWAIFTLYFVHVASDSWQDGLMLSHFARAFGEWSIPYIAGRLAVQEVQDWRWLTGIAVTLAVSFALWATMESVTRVNIANPAFGMRPADRTPPIAIRLGVKRAEGPTRHPIWFAMIQTLLLPWSIVAAVRGLRGDGPTWWLAMPFISSCGILSSVSRGPALAALGIIYLTVVFCLPKLRLSLIICGVLSVGIGLIVKGDVLGSLEKLEATKWGAELRPTNVEFDGKEHQFTAMSARWLVLLAYRKPVEQAGFLGFGTERTATFPVNVPFGPDAKQTISEFWTIDCEYLLLLLRFGWLGLVAFVAVCGCSIFRILKQAELVAQHERIFLYAVAATLIGVSVALAVEWMPHDYGFLFLWLCGVANGPRLARLQPAKREKIDMRSQRDRLRPS